MKRTIRDYTDRLIKARRDIEALFTAITELLAGAIDAKSPYTGGHCKRVPEVAKLLLAAAHESAETPFADFSNGYGRGATGIRGGRLVARLRQGHHTPEYVVDKATKLETIYNRIHEIRMRFEVLLRDAEIDTCHKRLAGNTDEAVLLEQLEEAQRQIADDFFFVAACNIGGGIHGRTRRSKGWNGLPAAPGYGTWTTRIGISQDEAALKAAHPSPTLPVVEHVLADNPEHVIPRADPDPFNGNPHGFTMTVPEHGYNLGELYNLSIRKGDPFTRRPLQDQRAYHPDHHHAQAAPLSREHEKCGRNRRRPSRNHDRHRLSPGAEKKADVHFPHASWPLRTSSRP